MKKITMNMTVYYEHKKCHITYIADNESLQQNTIKCVVKPDFCDFNYIFNVTCNSRCMNQPEDVVLFARNIATHPNHRHLWVDMANYYELIKNENTTETDILFWEQRKIELLS